MIQSMQGNYDVNTMGEKQHKQSHNVEGHSFFEMAQTEQSLSTTEIANTTATNQDVDINVTQEILYSGRNNNGAYYDMYYAMDSSSSNPKIYVAGIDDDGNEISQIIEINKINIYDCTVLEMKALETHMMNSGMEGNIDRMGGFFPSNTDLVNTTLDTKMNLMSLFTEDDVSVDLANMSNLDFSFMFGDSSSNSYENIFNGSFDAIEELFKALGISSTNDTMNEIDALYEQQKMLLGLGI